MRLSPMCSGDHGGGRVDGPAAITGCGHRSLETWSGLQGGKWPSPRGRLVTEESAAPARRVLGPNQAPSPPPGRPALQVGPALPDPCGSGRSGLVGAERWTPQVESGLGGTGAWRRPRLCGRGFLLRGSLFGHRALGAGAAVADLPCFCLGTYSPSDLHPGFGAAVDRLVRFRGRTGACSAPPGPGAPRPARARVSVSAASRRDPADPAGPPALLGLARSPPAPPCSLFPSRHPAGLAAGGRAANGVSLWPAGAPDAHLVSDVVAHPAKLPFGVRATRLVPSGAGARPVGPCSDPGP